MKITKAKLRQIVLEEAVKLGKVALNEWDYTASPPPAFDEEPDPDDFNLIDTIAAAGERVGKFASDTYEAGKDAVKDVAVRGATNLMGGEFGQDSYGLDGGERDIEGIEDRSYQRRVAPHLETYSNLAGEYDINPALLAGLMMDHDIRQYPDPRQAAEQAFDYWPVIRDLPVISPSVPFVQAGDKVIDQLAKHGANEIIAAKREKYQAEKDEKDHLSALGMLVDDEGPRPSAEEVHPSIGYFQNWKDMSPEQQKLYLRKKPQPATGFGGMKMSNIIGALSDPKNKNPRTGKPWLDLDKLLGIKNARNQSDITGRVGRWLMDPKNSIRAAAAFLAFQKSKNPNASDAQLATHYMGINPMPAVGGPRGQLAVKMGEEWWGGAQPTWWPHQSQEEIKEAVRAALKEFL